MDLSWCVNCISWDVWQCFDDACYVFSMKGLGRSEQGSTENIKVKVKNDNYGLGTMASYEVSLFPTFDATLELSLLVAPLIFKWRFVAGLLYFVVVVVLIDACFHRTTGSHTRMTSTSFWLNWTTATDKTAAPVCTKASDNCNAPCYILIKRLNVYLWCLTSWDVTNKTLALVLHKSIYTYSRKCFNSFSSS